MNSEFELIRYNENLPARIELKQGAFDTPYHWHKEIELVYVMDGAVTIKINTQDRSLHADEFVLMNSAENHSLSSEDAKCLILDISYEFQRQRGGGGDPQSSLAAFADAERAEASGLAAVCAYHGAPSCAVCPVQARKPQRCDQ